MSTKTVISLFIVAVLVFITSTNFKLGSGDDQNSSQKTFLTDKNPKLMPHEVYNDYNAHLVIPPYVYYPPTPDNPLVFTNVDISNNSPAPQNEPSVRVSRKNPNRVVAAWRDFRIGFNPAVRRVGYSYSTDGGTTWSPSALIDSTLLGGALLRNSDASVTSDTAGNFYITTIALNNSNGNATLAIYKSTDGGVTFPIGHILAQGSSEDKEMVTSDNVPGSPFKNNIYISWSRLSLSPDIRLIRSTDGGTTWSTPANVSSGGTTDGQGSDPVVGANGEVYVTWNGGSGVDIQEFNKSTNGGLSFGTPIAVATGPSPVVPFSQSGFTAFPSIACDVSGGPRNGYIYVSWCDNRNGDADVFVARSTDHGSTWSGAVRVNNDGIGNGKCQAWPWIAVNDSGKIAVLYYSCQNTPNNNTIEAWMGRSYDGGLTFQDTVLSTQQSPTATPNSDVRFGDYLGNDYWTNKIVPVWTDERAGGFDMEIYTANLIDNVTGIAPVVNSTPKNYELQQNYPNPFNPTTTISFLLPKESKINLSVYDINGQLVSRIFDGNMNAGKHSITWSGNNLSSGVYFYKLTTNGFSDTKKMLLVK
jgi:hypothetical protein